MYNGINKMQLIIIIHSSPIYQKHYILDIASLHNLYKVSGFAIVYIILAMDLRLIWFNNFFQSVKLHYVVTLQMLQS